jgi:hypothetical protein
MEEFAYFSKVDLAKISSLGTGYPFRIYGLTDEEYSELLMLADDHCMMCGVYGGTEVIDHDHATGKVRGLICISCNAVLCKERTIEAIDYVLKALERNK